MLGLVTDQGEDRELAGEGRKLALAWLGDHAAVDPDLVRLALDTAARYGDRGVFDRFYGEAKKATDRRDRQRMLGALSSFRDPELAKRALSLVLTDDFDIRESMPILFGSLRDPRHRRMVYDFVKLNYDAMMRRMPQQSGRRLVGVAAAQCDATLEPDAEAFFKGRMADLPGGPRDYAQAMERLDLCARQREAQPPSVAASLKAY